MIGRVTNETISWVIDDIINMGLGHQETIELIKNYHGIKIDFRTTKGKTLLQQLGKAVEKEYGV